MEECYNHYYLSFTKSATDKEGCLFGSVSADSYYCCSIVLTLHLWRDNNHKIPTKEVGRKTDFCGYDEINIKQEDLIGLLTVSDSESTRIRKLSSSIDCDLKFTH